MIKRIKHYLQKRGEIKRMNDYVEQLKEPTFNGPFLQNLPLSIPFEKQIEIERASNKLLLEDQEILESTYDPKASFVTYNGVPYNNNDNNKQTK